MNRISGTGNRRGQISGQLCNYVNKDTETRHFLEMCHRFTVVYYDLRRIKNEFVTSRVAGAEAARSRPFWLEPEPFFCSGSYSYSTVYSTVNILFLRDPKYDYDYDYKYDHDYKYDYDYDYENDYDYDDYDYDSDYDDYD